MIGGSPNLAILIVTGKIIVTSAKLPTDADAKRCRVPKRQNSLMASRTTCGSAISTVDIMVS